MDQLQPTEPPPVNISVTAIDKSKDLTAAVVEQVPTADGAAVSTRAQGDRPVSISITPIEIVFGIFLMLVWVGLLALGTIYSSTVYGERLVAMTRQEVWETIGATAWYFLLFVLTYTVTNSMVLCVLAAALGEAGRRDRIGDETQAVKLRTGLYFGAMIRGFMTYLIVISGSVVIANKSYNSPTREDYLTFAATVSVLGFLAGYNPDVFVRFMNGLRFAAQTREVASPQASKAGGVSSHSAERKTP
jgi:hypothetical protein